MLIFFFRLLPTYILLAEFAYSIKLLCWIVRWAAQNDKRFVLSILLIWHFCLFKIICKVRKRIIKIFLRWFVRWKKKWLTAKNRLQLELYSPKNKQWDVFFSDSEKILYLIFFLQLFLNSFCFRSSFSLDGLYRSKVIWP